MLVIEKLPDGLDGNGHLVLAERERDTIVMTFEERRWLRRRATTASGRGDSAGAADRVQARAGRNHCG